MAAPNWSNQTIWTGDCLEILRGMNAESVDLIYLDPPFNSKANYAAPIGSKAAGAAFKDTWTLSDVDAEWINLIEAKHPTLYRVLLAAMTGSDKSYLAYMAARLIEMRRVLKPTGSLYLHCDPTMSHYLKLVLDALARDLPGGGMAFQKRDRLEAERREGKRPAGNAILRSAERLPAVLRRSRRRVSPAVRRTRPGVRRAVVSALGPRRPSLQARQHARARRGSEGQSVLRSYGGDAVLAVFRTADERVDPTRARRPDPSGCRADVQAIPG